MCKQFKNIWVSKQKYRSLFPNPSAYLVSVWRLRVYQKTRAKCRSQTTWFYTDGSDSQASERASLCLTFARQFSAQPGSEESDAETEEQPENSQERFCFYSK